MTRLWESLLRVAPQPAAPRNDLSVDEVFQLINDPLAALLRTSWGSQSDEELVTSIAEAYRTNGPVYALCLARMQVFSQARFQWTRSTDGTPSDLFGTADLQILEFPWPKARTAKLLSIMEVDDTTAGNAFIRRLGRNPQRPLNQPDRLVRLRPQWVTIIMGSQENADAPWEAADVEVIGYAYKPNGDTNRMQVFGPEEVAHYAPMPDPVANFRGQSWVTPSMITVRADSASEVHKHKFFTNAATPNLAIKFDAAVKADQIEAFKNIILEDKTGVANAYKTIFLGGGADPVVIGKDFQQMAFAATQGKGETRLAADAGVPPSWVGFSEGLQGSALNDGNYNASRRRFVDGTLQHLWEEASTALEQIVDRPLGTVRGRPVPPARLTVDPRSIPALREDMGDLAEARQLDSATLSTLVNAGFTPESAVAAVDANDWTLLVHSGLTSVQLRPPADPSQQGASDA